MLRPPIRGLDSGCGRWRQADLNEPLSSDPVSLLLPEKQGKIKSSAEVVGRKARKIASLTALENGFGKILGQN